MYRVRSVTPRGRMPIPLGQFTIVVGPNNAGKSQLLRDIALCASNDGKQAKILEDVDIDFGQSAVDFLCELVKKIKRADAGQYYLDGAGLTLNETNSRGYDPKNVERYTKSEDDARAHIAETFTRQLLAYLTTEARLTFSKRQTNLYHPTSPGAASLVEALYYGSTSDREWLSKRTKQAFGLAIALDHFTNPGALEIRVADSSAELPGANLETARALMEQCNRLDEQGDGIRSFVATVGAAKTLTRDVILIDEPEAFLHPPQAFQIGRALSEHEFNGRQFICATHSADFLRGVLSNRQDITVIRVSRHQGGPPVMVLEPEVLKTVAYNPVLSSGRVLDGIFYRQVVITESDGDAVMYGAVSNKLEDTGETYYVNSYSKQQTDAVATPYKHMGVPHAAIVDIDLISVGPEFEKVAKVFLENFADVCQKANQVRSAVAASNTEELIKKALEEAKALQDQLQNEQSQMSPAKQLEWLRARLAAIRADSSLWSDLKRHGENSATLSCQARKALLQLIENCNSAGLFLVPVGERESWLVPDVAYSKKKTQYTEKALAHIASREFSKNAPLYKFVEKVHDYLKQQ